MTTNNIDELRYQRQNIDRKIDKAQNGRLFGIIGVIIGAIIWFSVSSALGIFIILAGVLAAVTQHLKVISLRSDRYAVQSRINQTLEYGG